MKKTIVMCLDGIEAQAVELKRMMDQLEINTDVGCYVGGKPTQEAYYEALAEIRSNVATLRLLTPRQRKIAP